VTRSPEVTFAVEDPNALRNYTQRYSYDPVGNITRMQHSAGTLGSWTRFYQYAGDSNRLIRTWQGDERWDSDRATNKTQYLYDIHGSILNLADVEPGRFLRWDTRDMIHALDLVGGGWAYYQYDSNKQRTRKRIEHLDDHTVEVRFYLGGMEWYRRWLNGNLVEEIETHHLFVDDQRVLIVEDVIETDSDLLKGVLDRYQYSSHLGSVGLELDGAARIISYEEYHPYGTTAYQAYGSEVKAIAKRYHYTGMERDEESGLSYHTARYYLPWLGRWGSCDPIGIEADSNIYRYTVCNPINLVDLYGKQARTTRQLWLAEQRALAIRPRATRSGRGITPLQREALHGMDRGFGPGTGLHWGHPPEHSHGTTPAGGDPSLIPQDPCENCSLGATADRQATQAARSSGAFARDTRGIDTSVPPRTRISQPPPGEVEHEFAAYERRARGRSGYATIGTLLTVLEIAVVAHAVIWARTPEERVSAGQLALGTAAGMAISEMAIRYLGAAPASGPLSVLFLAGDTPGLQEREAEYRFRQEWQQHVNQIVSRLEQDFRQLERALVDLGTYSEDYRRSGHMWTDEYLQTSLRDLASRFTEIRRNIIGNLEQLSVQDLPNVRQQLEERGLSRDLINNSLR
jgi:RHS repeat-associated protein